MKTNRLYNVIFPIWLLWLFPPVILIVIPANLIIDFLALLLIAALLKLANRREVIKKSLWWAWLFGFAADLIGAALLFLVTFIDGGDWFYDNIQGPVSMNPFSSVAGFLVVLAAVAVAAFFIYLFNYKVSLRKTALSDAEKRKTALLMAVFTAPYTFFLPVEWFLYY